MADSYGRARARRPLMTVTLAMGVILGATACGTGDAARAQVREHQIAGREPGATLVVYAREPVELSKPLFKLFEQQTGIRIQAHWGSPADLAEEIISDDAKAARRGRRLRHRGARRNEHQRWPDHGQSELNAASKAAAGGSMAARRRTKERASGAPMRRSMPASSHSMEMGPS
jgi:hypothetical protein